MNAPETHVRPTTSSSTDTTTEKAPPPPPPPPAPAGFWKLHHVVIGLVVVAVVVMMMRACGSDEPEAQVSVEIEQPREAIVVQIPASQLPLQQSVSPPAGLQTPQQGYRYAPPAAPAAPPVTTSSNPWSTRARPRSYGSYQSQQWGQTQQSRPQSYSQLPGSGAQYRPIEQPQIVAPVRPAPQPQMYYPAAPYDSLTGSSFGNRVYPYGGGAYPGHYAPGTYGMPGGIYAPGMGWPGYR